MPIGQLNVNNQEDLISRGAINEGEPDIQRHGGFTVRFPAVPRCAPQGSITILMAVHLLGRSLYGDNWTGEELAPRYRTEPTDQELAGAGCDCLSGFATRPTGYLPGSRLRRSAIGGHPVSATMTDVDADLYTGIYANGRRN